MPVPDNYYVEPNKAKKFFPIPADKYQVMIYDVNPIQEQSFRGDEMVDKLEFVFVVLDDKKYKTENEEGQPVEASTKGRRLWRKIPRSFSPGGKYKASLFFELMCAIERRTLDKEDLVKVQPNTLIGQQLQVFVSVNEQWNNIDSFLPAEEDMTPVNTVLDFDTDEAVVKGETKEDGFIEGLEKDKAEAAA